MTKFFKKPRKHQLRQLAKQVISFMLIASLLFGLIPEGVYASNKSKELQQEEEKDTWLVNSNLMQNKYLGLYTSNDGQFSIGTTGGNPENEKDDNQKMLYGYNYRSTSYTTFRINGSNKHFYAAKSSFDVEDRCNQSEGNYGTINVKQKLSLIHNSATGREDTVEIRYVVKNNGEKEQTVGCRIMLDTQLGSNDSSPFRIPGVGSVTTETEFEKGEIPQIWQSFDNLSNPSVIAQGRFYKSIEDRPDKVQFANWARLSDNSWEYKIQKGVGNGDSAVAATWYEKTLKPGEEREYVTYYGLSELSQDLSAPLTLSVYSEAELEEKDGEYYPNPFPVNAYIENIGQDEAKEVRVTLQLPKGLQLKEQSKETVALGDMKKNAMAQATWQVEALDTQVEKDYHIKVILTYDNGASKSVSRKIHVPATTKIKREVPKALNYTLFSESNEQNLSMYGWKSYITGDVYTGKNYTYNGSILDITGTVDAVGNITTDGWQMKVDEKHENVEPIVMPDLKEDIVSKAKEVDYYEGSKTFTEDSISLKKSIQSNNDITFAGTTFKGTGYVIANNHITCGLNQGSTYNDGKIVMYSENGNITLNGSELYLNGILYAPNGTVSVNANIFHLKGRIIAKHIIMNGSQIYIEGQEDDKEYLFDETLPSDENTKGSYTRTFTSDDDFREGTLKNVSQQTDDALILEQIDSDQIKQEKDTREYDARKKNTGFTITDSLSKQCFQIGNDNATLTYELTSYVNGKKEAEDNQEYNYVAPAAGRKVLFETTLLHAEHIDLTRIQPEADNVVIQEDNSVTLQWKYDRLVAGDKFTYQIPLKYKELSEEGVFPIVKNTSLLYYDEEGNPQIAYLSDRYATVANRVSDGTWEMICDGTKENTHWNHIEWNGIRPEDSDIVVEAFVCDSKTDETKWVKVTNGSKLQAMKGRYLKVKCTLKASSTGKTPVLEDITISTEEANIVANEAPVWNMTDSYEVATNQPIFINFSSQDDAKGIPSVYQLQLDENIDKNQIEIKETGILGKEFIFKKAGTYHVTMLVSDGAISSSHNITFHVTDTILENIGKEPEAEEADTECPVVSITKPTANEIVDEELIIVGTAKDEQELAGYELTYRKYEEETDHVICTSQDAVDEKTLGTLNTKELTDGGYILTLIAKDTSGNQSVATVGFIVQHKKEIDDIPPEVAITDLSFNEDKTKILVSGVIKDETKLNHYIMKIKDSKEKETILAEGSEGIENKVIAEMETDQMESGEYTLVITATDQSGNETEYTMLIQYIKGTTSGGEGAEEDSTITIHPNPDESETKLELHLSHEKIGIGDTITGFIEMSQIKEDSIKVMLGDEVLEVKENQFTYMANEAGTLTFVVTATDQAGNTISKEATCNVYDLSDQTKPIAKFISPQANTVLNAPTKIVGTAKDEEGISYYRLDYAMKGEETYINVSEKTEAIEEGELGTLDTTLMENGIYNLRLTVEDKGGNRVTVVRTIMVEGERKVGNMHIGFSDITAKLSGASVSINRIYDSRNKAKGDFGIGWTMGIHGMKVTECHSICEGYEMVQGGSALSTTYQMKETVRHDVVVNYGDGTSDRFKLTFNPEKKALVPITEVTIGYQCVTNPKVKLEILCDTTAYVTGNELYFYDDNMYEDLNYKLTNQDGVEFYLNHAGVYQIVDTNDNVITVDKNGYHATNGKSIIFTRDIEDRIIKATDPSGNEITYSYDENGDLISVTDSAERVVSYVYDKKHNLIAIKNPMGVCVTTNEYDENGRLIATIDAEGNRTEYEHDIDGKTETITDGRGNTTVYTYDDNGNVLQTIDPYGNKTTNTYDEDNNLLTTTDANGNTTSYAYDNLGNVTEVTAADGTKVTSTYTQESFVSSIQMMDQTIMAMDYDRKGRISSITDAKGNETKYSYDQEGNLTSLTDAIGQYQTITYDSEGNVATTTNGAGESASYTYNEDGKCTSVTISREENGETKTFTSNYTYNEAGEITKGIDNAGNVTTYEYDENGNQTAIVDAKGRRTTYTYDDRGNMTGTTYPDGTKESFTYDACGNNVTATDRSGLTITMEYDKLNRMTQKQYPDGTKETYVYDSVGNVIETTSMSGATTTYTYDSRNRNTAITDAYGHTTTFDYDEAARLTKRTDAKGNTISYGYDENGNLTTTTDGEGNSITSEYDARNRITKQTDANGNETTYTYDGADRLIKVTDAYGNSYCYGYDANGNLVTVTDAKENVMQYSYDEVGRVKTVQNPLGQTMEYSYDELGNVTAQKDYAGEVTHYTYNNRNQLVTKTVGEDNTQYSYDNTGLLTKVTDHSGTITYEYDNYSRLITKTDARGVTLSYSYDEVGRLKTFDNGFGCTSYEYDLLDRVVKVIDRNGQATIYEYDELGNRSAVRYANGTVVTYTYDACNRLKEEWLTDKDGNTISKYAYQLGKAGERTAITETDQQGVETNITYEYDKLNRLVTETIEKQGNKLTNDYTYDKVSNRTAKETTVTGDITALADIDSQEVKVVEGTTTYTYNALNQLVTEHTPNGETSYTYDDNGNLVKQSGETSIDYSYDKENHLLRATIQKGNSVTVEAYTYDYAGNRTSKTINESKTTYYVSDTSATLTMVVAETNEAGEEIASYTRGEELLSMEKGGQICYYLYDGHGSVRALTNEAGEVTDQYSYDAYGNLLEKEGSTENEFLYTGEQYNANTGLYYLRARYMNPSAGSFISMDSYQGSIYEPVTLHKYLYANANPVMYTDPSGYTAATEQLTATNIMENIAEAWMQAGATALRIFAKIRCVGQAEVIGITVSLKVTEAIWNVIMNEDNYSEGDILLCVQREILADVNQYILIETKEDAQAYALELAIEKNKRKYLYFCAYPLYPGASVSLRSGLTLEEARERIMFWGDVWAVDEVAAISLCNVLGGVSNEGATRDGNLNNALHYHAVMSLNHRHIYFGIDKNLVFVP